MSKKETKIKRWTAKRKQAVVMKIIKGKTTAMDVASEHGLTVSEVEGWQEHFMDGAEEFQRSKLREEQALHEAEKHEVLAKVGTEENEPEFDDLMVEVDADKSDSCLATLEQIGAAIDNKSPPVPIKSSDGNSNLIFQLSVPTSSVERIKQLPGVVGVFSNPKIEPLGEDFSM